MERLVRGIRKHAPQLIDDIARARIVEISIPWDDRGPNDPQAPVDRKDEDDEQLAARILPWEYVLSRATSGLRSGPLTVVRHLDVQPSIARKRTRSPRRLNRNARLLMVESVPGVLGDLYEAAPETDYMLTSVDRERPDTSPLRPQSSAGNTRVLSNPSLATLGGAAAEFRPGLIHVAGLDNRQAWDYLGDGDVDSMVDEAIEDPDAATGESPGDDNARDKGPGVEDKPVDGLALRGHANLVHLADARDVAHAVGAGHPYLVSYNLYNSARQIAACTVAQGADHAIGFQDTIDDRLAEQFFATLYHRLVHEGSDLLTAFSTSIDVLRLAPERLRGACVVLWSGAPIVPSWRPPSPGAKAKSASKKTRASTRNAVSTPADAAIRVWCTPNEEMNYSLLHNLRSPFERFQVQRRKEGPIEGISVKVTLYVGQESLPYEHSFNMAADEITVDLTDRIAVPLTSELIRTQSEKIRSVLSVEVRHQDLVLERQTYRMTLAPVDQWTDTDENRLWLPSFVLPRDPAVARIIRTARGYLRSVTDDPVAGFDGYQSVDGPADDEDVDAWIRKIQPEIEDHCEPVDLQVRAIWSAILYDLRLGYINPPPSYPSLDDPGGDLAVQRLRTPSEIAHWRHGTCIDLALLLCACLEYVNILPVVFLLDGHAFPGYWRSDALQEYFAGFGDARPANFDPKAGFDGTGVLAERLESAYTLPKSDYKRVRRLVDRGHIVPLEATGLTFAYSFAKAIEEGAANLGEPREFHSMIDIYRAREENVTPLPLVWRKPS